MPIDFPAEIAFSGLRADETRNAPASAETSPRRVGGTEKQAARLFDA